MNDIKIKNVQDIITEYLEKNGYDGLSNPFDDCACDLNNLLGATDCNPALCEPGYKYICPNECNFYDYYILTEKIKGIEGRMYCPYCS